VPAIQVDSETLKPTAPTALAVDGLDIRDPVVLANVVLRKLLLFDIATRNLSHLPFTVKEYTVSVTMDCLRADTNPGLGRVTMKAKVKKCHETKTFSVVMDGISWENFLTEVLRTHGIDQEYQPGFPIRLWYTRSL
jgi:hypothetical protein